MSRGFNTATVAAKSLATGLGVGFGIGAISGLGQIARNALDTADALGEVAERVGISTNLLQTLQFQARQTGSSSDEVTRALETFVRATGLPAPAAHLPRA